MSLHANRMCELRFEMIDSWTLMANENTALECLRSLWMSWEFSAGDFVFEKGKYTTKATAILCPISVAEGLTIHSTWTTSAFVVLITCSFDHVWNYPFWYLTCYNDDVDRYLCINMRIWYTDIERCIIYYFFSFAFGI